MESPKKRQRKTEIEIDSKDRQTDRKECRETDRARERKILESGRDKERERLRENE